MMKTKHILWAILLLWAIAGCAATSWSAAAGKGAADTAAHSDTEQSFTLHFPADFTVTTDPKRIASQSYFPLDVESMRLGGFYSGRDHDGTNFGSACIVVNASPAKERENDCARFEGDLFCGPEQEIREAEIHGVRFKYAVLEDAAVGHRLETRDYWTTRNGYRYDVLLSVSYTDIGMYTPGEKREFDHERCWKQLTDILGTFSFSPPAD